MVFGFGEGSIELSLNKTNFSFGETAEGTLKLKLKKPKQARQLRVSIICERRTTQYNTMQGRGRGRSSRTDILFRNDVVLDGERAYSPPGKDYQFKIQVPQKSAMPPELGGKVGTALKAAQFLGGQSSQIRWFVDAALDIPKGRDVSKRVQISVQ